MKIKRADIERILILCAAVLVVVLALQDNQPASTVLVDETQIPIEQTIALPEGETVATVVYYQDGDGYLVPVTRQVQKTDGIAKATLSMMVKSSENDMNAARLGLRTVIPEGTTFDIDIADGRANVSMSKEALNCLSAAEESQMVDAVVSALTCFSTVDEVTLEFDGQKRSKLTFGTDVSGVFTGGNVNLEATETFSEDANQVQLYFPSQTGRLLVPVTRTVFSPADLSTAILELVKGPKKDSGLEQAVQEKCGIRSVTVKNGVATIDFTREFAGIAENDDGGQLAVRAVVFTASQFPGVEKVNILVEGEPFRPAPETATTFVNQASEVMSSYPGVVEMD